MGFESAIPPIPSRAQEVKMIERFEREFLAQPSYRLYMNEALRKTKLEHGDHLNKVRQRFLFNFCLGAIISAPFIILSARFFHRRGTGVPFFFRPKYHFINLNIYNQARNMKAFTFQLPAWIGFSTWYGYRFTEWKEIDDENYDAYNVHKML